MQVYKDKAQAQEAADLGGESLPAVLLGSPGINFFTKDLTVKPRLSCNSTVALVYTNDDNGFQGTGGYNCYCRQKECVELACAWKEEIAFKDMRLGQGLTVPYPYSNISGKLDQVVINETLVAFASSIDYYEDNIIKSEHLDLESAAHPAAFSHTFHASMGKRWDDRDYPLFLGAGGSYEFGGYNRVLSRWLVWAKFGVSF